MGGYAGAYPPYLKINRFPDMNKLIKFAKQYPLTIILTTIISSLFFIFGAVPDSLYFNHEICLRLLYCRY